MPQYGDPLTPGELTALGRDPNLRDLGPADEAAYQHALKATADEYRATSVTLDEICTRLHITPVELSSMNVISIELDGVTRYPTWQLVPTQSGHDRMLPHLEQITAVMTPDLDAWIVTSVMTQPHTSLLLEGEATTPVQWLLRGGDSQALLDLLELIEWGY